MSRTCVRSLRIRSAEHPGNIEKNRKLKKQLNSNAVKLLGVSRLQTNRWLLLLTRDNIRELNYYRLKPVG